MLRSNRISSLMGTCCGARDTRSLKIIIFSISSGRTRPREGLPHEAPSFRRFVFLDMPSIAFRLRVQYLDAEGHRGPAKRRFTESQGRYQYLARIRALLRRQGERVR